MPTLDEMLANRTADLVRAARANDHPAAGLWAALKQTSPFANVIAIDIAESSDHIAYTLVSQYRDSGRGVKPVVLRDAYQFPIGASLPASVREIAARTRNLVRFSPLLCAVDVSGGRAEHMRTVAREAAGALGVVMGYRITSAYAEPDKVLSRANAVWLDPDDPKAGLVQVCSAGRVPLLTGLKTLSEQTELAEVAAGVPMLVLHSPGNHATLVEQQLAGLQLDTTPSGREIITSRGHDDLAIAFAIGVDACRWVQVLARPRRAGMVASDTVSPAGWT